MALTPQHVLRTRILEVLTIVPRGSMRRAELLRALDARYGTTWSVEDLQAPASRPFERKWQNNASFERANMVRDGLLSDAANGYWTLTAAGYRAAGVNPPTLTQR
jgi:hypothetical protein